MHIRINCPPDENSIEKSIEEPKDDGIFIKLIFFLLNIKNIELEPLGVKLDEI